MNNLIDVYDEVTLLVGEDRAADVVCIDFSNVFDVIFHDIIIDKLTTYGLDKWTVKYIENLLNS